MAEFTNISWADHTFNGWIGCTRVTPACDGCYAAAMMDDRYGRVRWGGPGVGSGTRERTSEANWRKPLAWDKKAKAAGTRAFVFCSSLADVFDNEIPKEWRADLFALIERTPNLVWLLLTKRPQNIVKMYDQVCDLLPWPKNAAIGTTVEDRKRLINLAHLARAAHTLKPIFTFGSFEPLLEEIQLDDVPLGDGYHGLNALTGKAYPINGVNGMVKPVDLPALGWVITGGETDQGKFKARPTYPDAFRSLRDQCARHGTPFHFKQWGNWASVSEIAGPGDHYKFPDGATVRRVPKDTPPTLDGIFHKARPIVEPA